MTITLPVHPLVGKKVRVLKSVPGTNMWYGAHLVVEHPDGDQLRILLSWTDHPDSPAAWGIAEPQNMVDVRDLLRLAERVGALTSALVKLSEQEELEDEHIAQGAGPGAV
ncbi:MAG: hypothetical protein ACNA8W_26800, partial [Bradymonadaceae bacterium]